MQSATTPVDRDAFVIAIDGPAGAGKSTVSRMLAESIGFEFLDTGAMYRCVTLAVLESGIDPKNEQSVSELADHLAIEFSDSQVYLNGKNVSHEIREPRIAEAIGRIADNRHVRSLLTKLQRNWAQGRCVVTEGRDQGSEVFYDSPCKIFLVASSEERAKRRVAELAARGIAVEETAILEQQNRRDQEDCSRPVGALKKASDAIEVCTDGLTQEQVVERLTEIVFDRTGVRPKDFSDSIHAFQSSAPDCHIRMPHKNEPA